MDEIIKHWIIEASKEAVPESVKALNIGLIEKSDGWACYLACCRDYKKDNSDWACEEVIELQHRYLNTVYPTSKYQDWKSFQSYIKKELVEILKESTIKKTWMGKLNAITVGFDDGDLEKIK